VKTITYRMVTLQTVALGPMPAVIPVPTAPQRSAPVPTAEALPRARLLRRARSTIRRVHGD
jgi:hypothetical protein